MAKDFQDIQQLDSEENDHQLGRGEGPGSQGRHSRTEDPFWKGTPPPQPVLLQRLCSRLRLSLLILGINVLLLVAICVIGSQRTQLQVELWTLKETFSNFSSSTLMEIQALSSHGGNAGDKVTSLEAKLAKQQQELKADHATLLLHLKHFPVDLRILACQLAFLQSNGTECCPVNWVEHEGSCYWFSHSGKTWSEAEKYCQLENAHLVVINSREEQKFIVQHTSPFHIWIGLTDSDGFWRWVDGTDYRYSYKNWAVTQPDNWHGHEQGGGEDCAEVRPDGRWNDDFCQQVYRWVCEMKQNITT
ncbi:asialoglycoprotein receptor 2-like [Equus asinus]|uniref:Asialoglycoprotein receptor 2 n=3 Tax=Equus TaxID=9789 RepID=A0A9L0TFZ8_HORSE|nr:asialoglycoprotein receptor 2 [Equus caballus]XP_014583912.1 asialoglycoprotein receptor 2 [Equus caballus]XP_014716965.1 asialoglycoprotein receptor 2-like [Equus asinus]XP_014716966.1 asialoglycoprotein receptor 2-like [Equus asinus]XP_023509166.1 asialoglycoprotein receptor 2 [Equus caballus]XP_023509167.1 asialoglycoprotein receptor 2 [Equus caballus]XP_044601633.1 asialoglycoprotein receptor 2-like [Equus asinus]XP_046530633.1 asialoglycoprotein receptor 2-like [Equus quagga]XP_0465